MRYLLLLAAAALAAAPAAAAPANPAASLSVAKASRASTPTAQRSALAGGGTYALAGFLAVVAVAVLIQALDDDADSN